MTAFILISNFKFQNMADTWGMLPKSQIDDETIEQAIARMLGDHEDDPNAHIEEGESLQSHKAMEVIDHIARSVVRDKLAFDRFQIETNFSSLDGFGKSAGVGLVSVACVQLETTAVTNNEQQLYIPAADANESGASPANSPFWQTTVKLSSTTNQLAYIVSGDPASPAGWGFKISNGILYAWYIDSNEAEQTQLVGGINLTNWNVYKIDFASGESIKFYVNGNLVWTATANLPSNAVGTFIFFLIKTLTTSARSMFVQGLVYDEDFFN